MKKINKIYDFTLIELLVVFVILGMIATLAGPQIMKQLGTAKLKIEDMGVAIGEVQTP